MAALYDQLASLVPVASPARDFVREVEDLPGLAGWRTEEPIGLRWPTIAGWGHALSMTQMIPGVDRIRARIASQILESGNPAPDTFAELSAVGLCVALGAVAAGRIPEGAKRTADWRMVWPPESEIDLEVTVGRAKKAHLDRKVAATALARELLDSSRTFDVVVDVVDPTNRKHLEDIRQTVVGISVGQTRAVAGSWEVRAEQITREPTVLIVAGQDRAPSWWPNAHARSYGFCGEIAGPETTRAPAQVRVWAGLPFDSYVNPIKRKAEAPQGTIGLPFLVAADVGDLPGAFVEIPRVMQGLLPFWTAVSGFLFFQDLVDYDRVGWLWRLVQNPHARAPLPNSLTQDRADLTQTMETVVRLR